MSDRLVAGVDSSTQSCKVELRQLSNGRRVGFGAAPHPPIHPPVSEQHPDVWWEAMVVAFRSAMRQAGASSGDVVAISVAAQCHGLVVLDANGVVVRPAKLWNDTTSTVAIRELRDQIGDQTLIRRTGSLPTSAFTLGKLGWLARHEPDNLSRVARVMLPHDYLTYRLTGRAVTDRSDASGTAYFDSTTNTYLLDHLRLVDDRDWLPMLPEVLGADETAGTLTTPAREALGLTGAVQVGAGGGDQHAAALGLGLQPGDVAYSFGTSGVVMAVSDRPVHDEQGHVDGVADMTDGYLPLVSTLNAARVSDTVSRLLGVSHQELSRLALAAPSSPTGPVMVAFLDGERTPDRPNAQGSLTGLTAATTREQVARSAYEGVVFGLHVGQRHLERVGVEVTGRVLAIGGGARSAAYTQILADTVQRPVLGADAPEATARGAAVQAAAVATGRRVAEVRTQWTPATQQLAEPRSFRSEAWNRYNQAAALTQLDRP